MQKKQFIDIENTRTDVQKKVMADIADAQHCPFCSENLAKYHTQPILRETKYWLLTKNQWPYAHTKVHLLAIYKTHAERLAELAPEAGEDLLELMQWAEAKYDVPGGGWAMRFGDTNHSAGTVLHIHAQFLVPDLESAGFEPVRIKIGKSPQK